jgi:predicted GTPase
MTTTHENIQKLVLVSPVNEPEPAESTFAPRVADLRGKRVGLLDNSKSNANKMLDAMAAILDRQYGFAEIIRYRKPSASKPVAPEVIEEIGKTCDVVIVGVGD